MWTRIWWSTSAVVKRKAFCAASSSRPRTGRISRSSSASLPTTACPSPVLGFHEHASWAVTSQTISFVDLEDIPGVFREPLPRVNLDKLPEKGAWLQPFRPLSALLNKS